MANMSPDDLIRRADLVRRLNEWRNARRAVEAARNPLIREAHEDGMSNMAIAEDMDINRGTVISVLGGKDEEGCVDRTTMTCHDDSASARAWILPGASCAANNGSEASSADERDGSDRSPGPAGTARPATGAERRDPAQRS